MDLPHHTMKHLSRRAFLMGACAAPFAIGSSVAKAHNDAGVVVPALDVPRVGLTLDDGRNVELSQLLAGRVSAVQLIFTRCRAICPIQGALFANGARKLDEQIKDAQFLSLSIEPDRDDPQMLRNWMARFGAHPRWRAGRPEPKQLDGLIDFLKSREKGPDGHTGQVYFFNRRGQLVLRSVDFPPAAEVIRVLQELDRQA